MANIPIRNISVTGTPTSDSSIVFDDGQMKRGTVGSIADAVRPVASQAESEAGSDNAKTITALRTKQSIASEVGVTIASKAQGDLANSAVQPGDLGTAAAADTTDFATAAQGSTADSAVQPGDLGDLALKDKVSVPSDLDVTGTPDGTKFLRDDGSWQDISGGGDLLSTNNLSDLDDADTALDNLGGTTVGKAIFTGEGGDARANVGSATMATLCVTFDTYRSAYDNAALTFMTTLGLVGTQFIIPEKLNTTGTSQSFTVDEMMILLAKGWEIAAYASDSTVTTNMADMYTADRVTCFQRLAQIRSIFLTKGFDVTCLAPMQRQWFDPQLTEMARSVGFKTARVANLGTSGVPVFGTYPIPEPLNVTQGGDATSMSSTTTASYLNGILDQAIAAKGLMITVTHEMNTPTDGSTVDPDVLEDFLTYAKGKQDLGLLRITALSKAMNPA